MADVWKTPYEIVGAGIPTAEAFYAKRDAEQEAQFAAIKDFGATKFRTGHNGEVAAILFAQRPTGWKEVGRHDGMSVCTPNRATKAGKDALQALRAMPRVTREGDLLDSFGWNGRCPMDGYSMYFATMVRLEHPTVRYLARLPRQKDDGFEPPETLVEIKASEYAKAFEDHNEHVRQVNEASKDDA